MRAPEHISFIPAFGLLNLYPGLSGLAHLIEDKPVKIGLNRINVVIDDSDDGDDDVAGIDELVANQYLLKLK